MKLKVILFICMICFIEGALAQSAKISGVITDAFNDEGLAGANVLLDGTSMGASTDIDGYFNIPAVPYGEYTLTVIYIGYKTKSLSVTAQQGKNPILDIDLELDVIEGETIEVTAMLEGQHRAINQQLNSNTIVNVVSSDKIQELPDQNAAEALGRLPGISVQRDAGEGQKVIIRGLSPKYNSVTINGEKVPSTDAEDRSVDLSMISPDMLAGIEVFKALTPDKDADAVGGTINFVVKKAPQKMKGDFRIQSGYNNHAEDFGVYKASGSASRRFYDNKLGVLVTGSLQRANRGSHVLDGSYDFAQDQGEERAKLNVHSLNLADRQEIRDRYGASMVLDYELPNGNIMLNTMWGLTNRDETRRRRRYNVDAFRSEHTMRDRQIDISLLSNSLKGIHQFDDWEINWQGSYSKTDRNTPFSHYVRFYEIPGFTNDLIDDKGPNFIPDGARNNLDESFFKYSLIDQQKVDDSDLAGRFDIKYPFVFGKEVDGYVKFGGKIRDKSREVDKSRLWSNHFGINMLGELDTQNRWSKTSDKKVRLINFIDPDFEVDSFLGGDYDFGMGLDVDKLNAFYREFKNYTFPNGDALYIDDPTVDYEDYSANEEISAGYFMSEVNLTSQMMLLFGFRYEHTFNDYQSITGQPRTDDEGQILGGVLSDTSGERSYEHYLPMFHARYKPFDWFDIRVALTKSLSRPNYFNLVPWRRIEPLDQIINQGNPDLIASTAWNYDLFLSFYNKYGLFTIGGFYKEVENVDYIRTSRVREGAYNGYSLIGPVNSEYTSKVKGFEIEIQTNLRYLPSPFDGFVIYLNYAQMSSETPYPLLKIERGGPPFYQATIIDTFRIERMPGQADDLANATLGYEKAGFSGRFSVVYQGESLMTIGSRSELDGYQKSYLRWDLSLKQKVTENISVFFNVNNITNRAEKSFLSIESFPTRQEFFGWTADFGIRYQLN